MADTIFRWQCLTYYGILCIRYQFAVTCVLDGYVHSAFRMPRWPYIVM